jgi:ribosomal protection tetracycline resistance protein
LRNLTLGIVAHVDAGKTSLTERLLHAAGVVDEPGSVDAGTTRTDSLELERRRGITIRAAVVSFEVDGMKINLIDTPGHPDFIAEVERSLGVLDGAVLVVSAVEGVQPQTRILWRALRRLAVPTLLFVNKIDRGGADVERVLAALRSTLSPDVVAMSAVHGQGTRAAHVTPTRDGWLDVLARHDDALLASYVAGEPVGDLCEALAAAVGRVHPVYAGSAMTGAGVDALVDGLTRLLPTPDGDGPVAGTVFKVDRGPAGERIAYVRMFAGAVAVRDRLPSGRVTAVHVFDRGAAVRRDAVRAGEIATLAGLTGVRVGDAIGAAPPPPATSHRPRCRRWSGPSGTATAARCTRCSRSSPTRTR